MTDMVCEHRVESKFICHTAQNLLTQFFSFHLFNGLLAVFFMAFVLTLAHSFQALDTRHAFFTKYFQFPGAKICNLLCSTVLWLFVLSSVSLKHKRPNVQHTAHEGAESIVFCNLLAEMCLFTFILSILLGK